MYMFIKPFKHSSNLKFQFMIICIDIHKQADRDESTKVDEAAAVKDANRLFEAGVNTWGTDEDVFISILTKQNFHQLRKIFAIYNASYGHTIEEAINNEFSGAIEDGLLNLGKCT